MLFFSRGHLASFAYGIVGGMVGFCSLQGSVNAFSNPQVIKASEIQIVGSDNSPLIKLGLSERGPFIQLKDADHQKEVTISISKAFNDNSHTAELTFGDGNSNKHQVVLSSAAAGSSLYLCGAGHDGSDAAIKLIAETVKKGEDPSGHIWLGSFDHNKIWLNANQKLAEMGMSRSGYDGLNMLTKTGNETPQIIRTTKSGPQKLVF